MQNIKKFKLITGLFFLTVFSNFALAWDHYITVNIDPTYETGYKILNSFSSGITANSSCSGSACTIHLSGGWGQYGKAAITIGNYSSDGWCQLYIDEPQTGAPTLNKQTNCSSKKKGVDTIRKSSDNNYYTKIW